MLTELLACAVGRSRSDALTNAKKKATERQFPAVTKVIIQSTERERESDRISSNWRHSWAMQMRPRVTYFSVRRRTRPGPIRFAPRSFRRRVQVCMWCGHVGWFTLPFLTLTDKTRVSSLSLSLSLSHLALSTLTYFSACLSAALSKSDAPTGAAAESLSSLPPQSQVTDVAHPISIRSNDRMYFLFPIVTVRIVVLRPSDSFTGSPAVLSRVTFCRFNVSSRPPSFTSSFLHAVVAAAEASELRQHRRRRAFSSFHAHLPLAHTSQP